MTRRRPFRGLRHVRTDARPMRYDVHLLRRDRKAGQQGGSGMLGHHHDSCRAIAHGLQNEALMRGGRGQHRVQHDDRWHGQHVHQLDDVFTVPAAVDAVLVLDDRGTAPVEHGGGVREGPSIARDELAADAPIESRAGLRGHLAFGQYPHDRRLQRRTRSHRRTQGFGERGQPAPRWGEGREEPDSCHGETPAWTPGASRGVWTCASSTRRSLRLLRMINSERTDPE